MPSDKPATSYRLSQEAKDLLAKLATHHGLAQTAVLEMLIRREARAELTRHADAGPRKPAHPSDGQR